MILSLDNVLESPAPANHSLDLETYTKMSLCEAKVTFQAFQARGVCCLVEIDWAMRVRGCFSLLGALFGTVGILCVWLRWVCGGRCSSAAVPIKGGSKIISSEPVCDLLVLHSTPHEGDIDP